MDSCIIRYLMLLISFLFIFYLLIVLFEKKIDYTFIIISFIIIKIIFIKIKMESLKVFS